MYNKVERGDHRAQREKLPLLWGYYKPMKIYLYSWLVNKIIATIGDEKELSGKAMDICTKRDRELIC